MKTIKINPANLNKADSVLLKKILLRNKHCNVFERNKKYLTQYYDETMNQFRLCNVVLTHDIIRRPRNRNPDEERFEVVNHENIIGEGGFSEVFEVLCTFAVCENALQAKKNKNRVVKVQIFSEEDLSELYKESKLSRMAGNLHIKAPVILHLDRDHVRSYSVMRKLNGSNLYSVISRLYRDELHLTAYQRLKITVNLLRKLHELHCRGIIHRDIKPENVMLDLDSGEIEIFDFGLSKSADENDTDDLQGTPGYIPLEVFLHNRTDAKSDIFSMSIVIGMVFGADEPGTDLYDSLEYTFTNIFSDVSLDLRLEEKNRILDTLKCINSNLRDERYSVEEALRQFEKIMDDYVNVRVDEMIEKNNNVYLHKHGLLADRCREYGCHLDESHSMRSLSLK